VKIRNWFRFGLESPRRRIPFEHVKSRSSLADLFAGDEFVDRAPGLLRSELLERERFQRDSSAVSIVESNANGLPLYMERRETPHHRAIPHVGAILASFASMIRSFGR